MEIIKKKFKLKTTTGSTSNGIVIIPDTSVDYSMKILLKSTMYDWGYFDVLEDQNVDSELPVTTSYQVTGTSKSRLMELKKYSTSSNLSLAYFTSNTPTQNGLDVDLSTSNELIYYINGITYVDNLSAGTTTFSFESQGYSSPNFVNLPIIKDEAKQNIIDKPEVDNDVFIIRQSLSAFQNIYRLQDVSKISEFESYAGGTKFNIIVNS